MPLQAEDGENASLQQLEEEYGRLHAATKLNVEKLREIPLYNETADNLNRLTVMEKN